MGTDELRAHFHSRNDAMNEFAAFLESLCIALPYQSSLVTLQLFLRSCCYPSAAPPQARLPLPGSLPSLLHDQHPKLAWLCHTLALAPLPSDVLHSQAARQFGCSVSGSPRAEHRQNPRPPLKATHPAL